MTDSLATLGSRYPALFDLLNGYAARLALLPQGEQRKFWLSRVAKRLATAPGHWIAQVLSKLNNIGAEILKDAHNSGVLKAKFSRCLPSGATVHREHYDGQLLDTFAEMLGYDYLRREGYASVHFLPEGREPRPDLEARGAPDRKPAVMECKNLHESEEQKDYFAHHQGEVRSVNGRLVSADPHENPFLRKLQDMAGRAVKQLNGHNPLQYTKIFFLNYTLDIVMGVIEAEFPDDVDGLFRDLASQLHQQGVNLVLMDRYGLGKTTELCRS